MHKKKITAHNSIAFEQQNNFKMPHKLALLPHLSQNNKNKNVSLSY